MARRTYGFEHGTDGANVATTGAVSPDVDWDLVVGSGNTDFDTAQAAHGSLSALINNGSAASDMRWTGWTANAVFAIRFYFRCDAFPTAGAVQPLQIRTAAEGVVGQFFLETTGRISAAPASGVRITGTNIAAHAISVDTWYRIDSIWEVNGASGRLRYRIALASTEADITTPFDSGAAVNFGTTNIGHLRFGPPGSGARGGNWWIDDAAAEDGLSDYIGPVAPSTAWALLDGAGGSTPLTLGILTA